MDFYNHGKLPLWKVRHKIFYSPITKDSVWFFENEFGKINLKLSNSSNSSYISGNIELYAGTFSADKVDLFNSFYAIIDDIHKFKLTLKVK